MKKLRGLVTLVGVWSGLCVAALAQPVPGPHSDEAPSPVVESPDERETAPGPGGDDPSLVSGTRPATEPVSDDRATVAAERPTADAVHAQEADAVPNHLSERYDLQQLDAHPTADFDPVPADPGYPKFAASGRILTGAERVRTRPVAGQSERDSRQPFFLQQARVRMAAKLHKRVRAKFSADLEESPVVRSAFVSFKIGRSYRFRAGRFKRPMSRIELTSIGQLPFRRRGVFNDRLIERAGWGDRALGMMFDGKLRALKLRYYAAVMNASEGIGVRRAARLEGYDALGRVQFSPAKWISLAVNGGHKVTQAVVGGPDLHLNAIGGDLLLQVGQLRMVLESMAAQNPFPPSPPVASGRTPWSTTAIGYVSYDWDLGAGFILQPVVAGEWTDTDMDVLEDETARLVVGLNWLWQRRVRVLPQVELIRPLGVVSARSQLRTTSYYLLLSVEI